MRTGRFWPLLLLLYVVVDFADPSIPGVFFFETDQLFVEAAVTLAKATTSTVMPAASPRSVDSGRGGREPSVPPARAFRSLSRHTDLRARLRVRSKSFRDASASVSSEDD
jgi:hypothetical protein